MLTLGLLAHHLFAYLFQDRLNKRKRGEFKTTSWKLLPLAKRETPMKKYISASCYENIASLILIYPQYERLE